jgi:hypothetical protein
VRIRTRSQRTPFPDRAVIEQYTLPIGTRRRLPFDTYDVKQHIARSTIPRIDAS